MWEIFIGVVSFWAVVCASGQQDVKQDDGKDERGAVSGFAHGRKVEGWLHRFVGKDRCPIAMCL